LGNGSSRPANGEFSLLTKCQFGSTDRIELVPILALGNLHGLIPAKGLPLGRIQFQQAFSPTLTSAVRSIQESAALEKQESTWPNPHQFDGWKPYAREFSNSRIQIRSLSVKGPMAI
jgi:hypothetical protein